MGDVLSALSIILGIVSALFLQWLPFITDALSKKPSLKDDAHDIYLIKNTIKWKVIPLLILSLTLSLIIVPVFYNIVVDSLYVIAKYKASAFAFQHYDIVSVILLFIGLLCFMLSGYLIQCLLRLKKKIRKK